ncbi:hypothetical protein AX16_000451 [Volvariella volvacea WC 439]|nr:hypothetical protein AX16_000451 [Volvariella volvacea WC 439]
MTGPTKLSDRVIQLMQSIEPDANFHGTLPAVESSSGATYYVKIGSTSEAEQYRGEAESLHAMEHAAPGLAPRVFSSGVSEDAKPYFVSEHKNLRSLSSNPGAAQTLARRLATELHTYKSDKGFGFEVPTYCGATRLQNGWYDSWEACFSTMIGDLLDRLAPRYANLKKPGEELRKRYVNGSSLQIELLIKDTQSVIPALLGRNLNIEPVLLHGDLWSGNVGVDSAGEPIIFDPASLYGHNEADLAIARIFGGFPSTFFTTYHQYMPKSDPVSQYDLRVDLYELFHYLNHTVLFGGSYAQSALAKMERLLAARL